MTTQKTSKHSKASEAAATTTASDVVVEDVDEDEWCEDAHQSGDEDALHGPCNVKPIGVDEDPRSVHVIIFFAPHISTNNTTNLPLHAQGLYYW